MTNEIETFLHGIVDSMDAEKLASTDLGILSTEELALFAFGDDPVLSKLAMSLPERAASDPEFKKQLLKKLKASPNGQLILHGDETKSAGDVDVPGNVSYDGDVNTGDPSAPSWPRAAMGVDSAGRRATGAEEKKQNDTATPQHTEPKTAYFKVAEEKKTHEKGLLRRGAESYPIQAGASALSYGALGALSGAGAARDAGASGKQMIPAALMGAGLGGAFGAGAGTLGAAGGRGVYGLIDKIRGSKGVEPKKSKEKKAGAAEKALAKGKNVLRNVGRITEEKVKDTVADRSKRHVAIGTGVVGAGAVATRIAGKPLRDAQAKKDKEKKSALLAAVERLSA